MRIPIFNTDLRDLITQEFANLGKIDFSAALAGAELIEHAGDSEYIIVSSSSNWPREILVQLKNLKYIGTTSTGYNQIDVSAARELGITVTNVPSYSTNSVAQTTYALLLEVMQQVGRQAEHVSKGEWKHPEVESTRELAGKTMGIIGFGEIGQAVAKIALAFGLNVLVYTRTITDNSAYSFVDLPKLLKESDFVSLHVPLNAKTEGLIGAEELALMRDDAILINTSRGAVIDETAVAQALHDRNLGALAADVLVEEPPSIGHPLVNAPRTWITPHIAWQTDEAKLRLIQGAANNLRAFMAGEPINIVN